MHNLINKFCRIRARSFDENLGRLFQCAEGAKISIARYLRSKQQSYLTTQAISHRCARLLTLLFDPIRIHGFTGVLPFCPIDYSAFKVRRRLGDPHFTSSFEQNLPIVPSNFPWHRENEIYLEERMGYVVEIDHGIAMANGIVLDGKGRTVIGASHRYRSFARRKKSSFQRILENTGPIERRYARKPLHLLKHSGPVLAINCSHVNAYTHYLFETLGRLALVEDDLGEYTKIYVPRSAPFQQQYLSLLDIPDDRIIPADGEDQMGIMAERLVVPCYQAISGLLPSSLVVDFFRRKLLPKAKSELSRGERIYVSRSNARRRRIANEDEILRTLADYKFSTLFLEELSVLEQISAFHHAKIVVAPHGTGLGNLLYCKPGASIMEIFSGVNKDLFFALSSLLGLNYTYLTGVGGNPNRLKNWVDIQVDPTVFRRELHRICQ